MEIDSSYLVSKEASTKEVTKAIKRIFLPAVLLPGTYLRQNNRQKSDLQSAFQGIVHASNHAKPLQQKVTLLAAPSH